MSCINTGHPQYKALRQLAVQDKRDTLDFYLDVSRYNDLYLKFPTSLSELDNGLEDIYYRDLLATEVFKIVNPTNFYLSRCNSIIAILHNSI